MGALAGLFAVACILGPNTSALEVTFKVAPEEATALLGEVRGQAGVTVAEHALGAASDFVDLRLPPNMLYGDFMGLLNTIQSRRGQVISWPRAEIASCADNELEARADFGESAIVGLIGDAKTLSEARRLKPKIAWVEVRLTDGRSALALAAKTDSLKDAEDLVAQAFSVGTPAQIVLLRKR